MKGKSKIFAFDRVRRLYVGAKHKSRVWRRSRGVSRNKAGIVSFSPKSFELIQEDDSAVLIDVA